MSSVVVVGAQWGDEGKGKIVDLYTEFAEVVVRYAGGPNAGHTLVVGDDKLVVRLLPSGVLRPSTRCVLAQGMVIDPGVLIEEMDGLTRRGHHDIDTRVAVSDRAHLILPYHVQIDGLREGAAREGRALGTTKKGIGPAYEDKARRTGVRTGDLRNRQRLFERIEAAVDAWSPTIRALGGDVPRTDQVLEQLLPLADRVVPLLTNTSALVDQAIRSGQRVMFEGAQGTLLDLDHGTYPFVTSSSSTAGGAAVGAGIGPGRIDCVIGITKAYTTRVGAGPFPTELEDEVGRQLRDVGMEFGSVTGRPRRTGWIDLPALRYAARVNGMDGLAITKLDVLTGIERIEACVAYETADGRHSDLPSAWFDEPESMRPVYETLEGWQGSLSEARSLADLPSQARHYIEFLEQAVGVPAFVVSVGARRSETIVIHNPLIGRAAVP